MNTIFNRYDDTQSGVIDYKEFINNVFGHPITDSRMGSTISGYPGCDIVTRTGSSIPVEPRPVIDYEEIEKIIDLLTYKLCKRGMFGILEF